MKHIVGFSGGIDSQACANYVLDRYPHEDVVLLNSNAGGNEHPITEAFVEWFSAHVFPVISTNAIIADLGTRGTKDGATKDRRLSLGRDSDPLTFDGLAYVKGVFPRRKSQFCTEHLKLAPQRRWSMEHCQPGEFERWIGVRRDESPVRACAERREYDIYFQCFINRPLVDWTKDMCFDFCLKRGQKINPLYTMGFSRVGCAPCINAAKDDIREWAARSPDMIDKVRRWEAKVGRTFFAPCVPGMEINWVDEVVAWSRTEWGGKQLSLPLVEAEADAGICSSKYGLCE